MKGCDVIVVGAGPAGATLATVLRRDGIAVRLVDGGEPLPALEGYSARTVERLRAAGLSCAEAVLSSALPRAGSWAGRPVSGFEHLADRAAVHRALRRDALAAGVSVISARWTPALTESALRNGSRLVIDARGRHGPAERGPVLLSICATAASSREAIGTSVGMWSEGWYWLVDDGERAQIQLVGLSRGRHPTGWVTALLAERPELTSRLRHLKTPWLARPAYARLAKLADPLLAVGDAALAVDPLSGHGTYEALRGADLHACAVRTLLAGGDPTLIRGYLTDRRHETWSRTLSAAADIYAEPAALSPFWQECAHAYRQLAQDAPRPRVTQSSITSRPVLENGYIQERPVVVTPSVPRGAWRVAGIPLVELYDFLRSRPETQTALSDAACRFGHPLTAVRTAAQWLNASGMSMSGSAAS